MNYLIVKNPTNADIWFHADNAATTYNFPAGAEGEIREPHLGLGITHGLALVGKSLSAEVQRIIDTALTPPATTEEEQLIFVCLDLIAGNDPLNFTRSGRPRIEVARGMVEFPITADQLRSAYDAAIAAESTSANDNISTNDTGSGLDSTA